MKIQDDVLVMFTARLERSDGAPVFEVPHQEIELGTLLESEHYRIAVLETTQPTDAKGTPKQWATGSDPPVSQGEHIEVEIEDMGEQGDGIARVGPGYVIFVEDADVGDRHTVEIRKVLDNYAFARVVDPEPITG